MIFEESVRQYNRLANNYWTYAITSDSSFQKVAPTYQVKHQRLKRFVNKSALFSYIQNNLRIYFDFRTRMQIRLRRKNGELEEYSSFEGNIIIEQVLSRSKVIDQVTHHILNQFKIEFPDKRIIFVMDAPRRNIYSGNLEESKLLWMRDMVQNACLENGFEFIALTPHFKSDYEKNQQRFELRKMDIGMAMPIDLFLTYFINI